jgi:hypothetical protein
MCGVDWLAFLSFCERLPWMDLDLGAKAKLDISFVCSAAPVEGVGQNHVLLRNVDIQNILKKAAMLLSGINVASRGQSDKKISKDVKKEQHAECRVAVLGTARSAPTRPF